MSPATDGPQYLRNRLSPFRTPVIVHHPETSEFPAVGKPWLTVRTAIVALVVLGVVLRAVPLIQNRCLWIDEAMLALNLVERSPRQLLEPLDWNQGAPAGFLLAVKAAMSVFGSHEWALRLFPFAVSVAGTIGFAAVARRVLPPGAAVLAVGLYAISPSLISYSAECKQYSTDAALTVGALAASLGLLSREGGARRWAVLAAFGAGAVWFSHPIVFVLSALGTALFLDCLILKDRRRTLACAAAIGAWLASFGVCYFIMLRHLGNNHYLLDYWAGHFCPLPPASLGDLSWLASHLSNFVEFPGGLGGTDIKAGGLAGVLFLIGAAAFRRERRTVAFMLLAPAGFALVASGLNKYPFAGRLLLFLVPLLLLGVARGAWAVAEALRSTVPFARVAILGVLVLAPAIETYQHLRRPPRTEQLTEVLADVRREYRPGDVVYLYWGAVPAYTFYSREQPFVPGMVIKGTEYHDERLRYRDELKMLKGERRVWLVFSHRHQSEDALVLAYAESQGDCLEELHRPGANAYLFDFSHASRTE